MQTATGIRELKIHLSQYLRRVKKGETILITERGKPVGRIVPIQDSEGVEERLERLVASGLVEWNGQRYQPEPPRAKVKGNKTVAELLLEDRD